ncbi:MAG: hypothetical protein IPP94_05750 [Ignavibacteria bacterium]|nr:hypothetical protein [Ignavibacteria bacterium]
MNVTSSSRLAILVFLLFAAPLCAQEEGRIVFKDPKNQTDNLMSEEDLHPRMNAWGVDVMVGNDGVGLGFFYHLLFSEDLTGFADLSFSEAKDARQIDFVDYYYGTQWSPNKENRVFRIPLFFGLQYRLFREEIVDNFRPYINGGIGPVMLYITEAKREFFESLGFGHSKYTYGGFLGAGAQFGFDRSSVFGLNLRYMIIPTPKGTQAVQQGELPNANGFFITFNIGMTF